MKKLLGFLFCLGVVCGFAALPAAAQAPTVLLEWNAPIVTGITITGYNLYRAPCTGTITAGACSATGTYAKITATPVSGLTYTDSTVVAGNGYVWRATSVCSNCSPAESTTFSNVVARLILNGPPPPPVNLIIVSASASFDRGTTTVQAAWTGEGATSYVLTDWRGNVLQAGASPATTGNHSMMWQGQGMEPKDMTLTVCDASGACQVRTL